MLIAYCNTTLRSKQKEESAKLLCLLIEASSGASSTLIKPYAGPLLSVLLRTASAKDTNPAVASYCLACLGELARVSGEEISPSVDKIMALIMEMLADQTSSLKRDAALKTLGQVASNTGAVIEPYHKYPHLLAMLMRFLKTEKSQNIRRETIRTMGMLGALDPYKHKLLHDETDEQDADASGARVTDVQLLMNAPGTSPDEFYQTVTINALVNVLADPTLTNNHWSATEAVMLIFTTQGLKCVPYLGQVCMRVFKAFVCGADCFANRSYRRSWESFGSRLPACRRHISISSHCWSGSSRLIFGITWASCSI